MRVTLETQFVFLSCKHIIDCARHGSVFSCILPYLFLVKSDAQYKVLQKHDDGYMTAYQKQNFDVSVERNVERAVFENILLRDERLKSVLLGLSPLVMSHLQSTLNNEQVSLQVTRSKAGLGPIMQRTKTSQPFPSATICIPRRICPRFARFRGTVYPSYTGCSTL